MELILLKECEKENTQLYGVPGCPDYNILITKVDSNTFNYRIIKTVREGQNFETRDAALADIKKYMERLL